MLLAVDIGNTNIHFGLWNGEAWAESWRAQTLPDKMPDEYAMLLRNYLESAGLTFAAITGIAVSSVVPRLTRAFTELSQTHFHQEPLIVTSATDTGIRIAIDQPEQAGADRIVNTAAVVALYRYPAIVLDFGTATTFDVVTADGAYCGGAIAPGIGVASDALVSRTSLLHKVDLIPPARVIGGSTITAMQSGIFWGYMGLVEGLITRIKAELEAPDALVLATGGLAALFKQNSTMIDEIAPELTLEGLRVIYERNAKKAG